MPAGFVLVVLLLAVAGCGREEAPPPLGPSADGPAAALVEDLREGGHVLVVRHTTTESTTDRVEVVGDCARQRNLSEQGRREARELGEALAELDVPLGDVRASPLCRTLETADPLPGPFQVDEDLISPAVIGTEADDLRRAERLRELAATPPPRGTNTVLVTHTGTIGGAFGESLLEGEALVFRPDGSGGATLAGRIGLDDWRALAGRES